MSFRYPKGGFITAFYDPLQVPNAPTNVSAAGDAQATVTFTAPANVGGSAITGYVAQAVPDGITATGSASPLTVTGLTNGTAYTINVAAINSYGPGPYGTSGSVTPAAARGLFGGGYVSATVNTIVYVSIASTGNATDFGDLSTTTFYQPGACASSTRGLFAGGIGGGNVIDYITISTLGNATDFGDLTVARKGIAGLSNSTRGLFCGGEQLTYNTIDYVTIASAGNATDFGDLTGLFWLSAGCASSTRGIIAGGQSNIPSNYTYSNVIQYVTIASAGNATDFGDLTVGRTHVCGCSSSTIGVFFGGNTNPGGVNVIDYITIASTGNATDFGDLLTTLYGAGACSNSTRGLVGGGQDNVGATNVIQYITIASTGNSSDFGDLTANTFYLAACSNGHGGL